MDSRTLFSCTPILVQVLLNLIRALHWLIGVVYTEWVSGGLESQAQWNTTQTADCVYHRAQRSTILPMQETDDIAEDSAVYYVMATVRECFENHAPDRDIPPPRHPRQPGKPVETLMFEGSSPVTENCRILQIQIFVRYLSKLCDHPRGAFSISNVAAISLFLEFQWT